MKIASFNINSIRAKMLSLQTLIKTHNPDIIGLQEIKVQNSEFPLSTSKDWPYDFTINGQKSYHGVAIMSKIKPESKKAGIEFEKDQARFSYTQHKTNFGTLHFINCYFPQGEARNHPLKFPYKMNFYNEFIKYLKLNFKKNDLVMIVVDFNIAPTDLDVGIGEANAKRWLQTGKCSFLPEEREIINQIFGLGFSDCYRNLYPKDNKLTWFDYRSKGFEDSPKRGLRIDYCLTSEKLSSMLKEAVIDYDIRSLEKPSDHCAIVYDFDIKLV